jgi:hypothetical protein
VEAEAPENMPLPLPVCFKVTVQILVDFCELEAIFFLQILFDIDLNYVQIILVFLNNDVKYYITNCISTFQEQKQNWKLIWKRKRYRKRLLSAGSGSARNWSASASLVMRIGPQ